MGFVGLVKLAVKCFDILAWPLLALVFPLWASIRAIEADDSSSSDCRKLVAYWVLFSLIFLFEQAFDTLLLWLPLWLYMKLIITCCLVIPNFDGALYAYKHLVCPCLSIDIKVLINKFNAKSSNFDDEVNRYVKEKGPEALEELVASKLKCSEPNVVQKDVKTVQVAQQIKEVATSKQVKFVPDLLQKVSLMTTDISETENKIPETDLFSSDKVEAVGESSEIPLPEQVQKEWTCAICQLILTRSETTLKDHLQGKRHKKACEELKTKNQQPKNKASTIPKIKIENKIPETDPFSSDKVEAVGESSEIPLPKQVQKEWTCAICQLTNQSQTALKAHLEGKRHKKACEELKAKNQQPKNKASTVLEIKKVSLMATDISQTENKIPETDQFSSDKVEAVGESSEIPLPKQVQKEWTCAICQLTNQSETALKVHLEGKRHKKACEELKAKNQQPKNKASTVLEIKLKDWKEHLSKKNELEAEVKDNVLEPCELKCRAPNIEQKSVKTVQETKREEVAIAKQAASLSETFKNNLAAEEIKEISGKMGDTGGKLSENQDSNQVQKEWTCTLCQVTTQNEITFNSHLQGRRHKAACEELKTAWKELKTACEEFKTTCEELKTTQQSENKAYAAPEIKEEDSSTATKTKRKRTRRRRKEMQSEEKVKSKCDEFRENLWWCNICNLSCSSKGNMDTHLNSKKHMERIMELVGAHA